MEIWKKIKEKKKHHKLNEEKQGSNNDIMYSNF